MPQSHPELFSKSSAVASPHSVPSQETNKQILEDIILFPLVKSLHYQYSFIIPWSQDIISRNTCDLETTVPTPMRPKKMFLWIIYRHYTLRTRKERETKNPNTHKTKIRCQHHLKINHLNTRCLDTSVKSKQSG